MTTFDTILLHGDGEEDSILMPVSVSYEMRDVGVMGRPNERVRPFIHEVLVEVAPGEPTTDIIYQMNDDQMAELEEQAARHEAGLRDLIESYRGSD